jgi:hypothetical protein
MHGRDTRDTTSQALLHTLLPLVRQGHTLIHTDLAHILQATGRSRSQNRLHRLDQRTLVVFACRHSPAGAPWPKTKCAE